MESTHTEKIRSAFSSAIQSVLAQTAAIETSPPLGQYNSEIVRFSSLQDQLEKLPNGFESGEYPGWLNLDKLYRPSRGQWTVITGVPSHGKSTWMDCLMLNLIVRSQWKIAVFSAENQPVSRYAINLIQKYSGCSWQSLTTRDKEFSLDFLSKRLFILDPIESHLSLDYILDIAKSIKLSDGLDGLVIDPWNELDHSSRQSFQPETEFISQALSRVRRFSRKEQIHVWIVAHPMKLVRDKSGLYPKPSLYDISGSAAWRSKCDFGICVWRDMKNVAKPTEVHVLKVRFPENGEVGIGLMRYDPSSGRFLDAV